MWSCCGDWVKLNHNPKPILRVYIDHTPVSVTWEDFVYHTQTSQTDSRSSQTVESGWSSLSWDLIIILVIKAGLVDLLIWMWICSHMQVHSDCLHDVRLCLFTTYWLQYSTETVGEGRICTNPHNLAPRVANFPPTGGGRVPESMLVEGSRANLRKPQSFCGIFGVVFLLHLTIYFMLWKVGGTLWLTASLSWLVDKNIIRCFLFTVWNIQSFLPLSIFIYSLWLNPSPMVTSFQLAHWDWR